MYFFSFICIDVCVYIRINIIYIYIYMYGVRFSMHICYCLITGVLNSNSTVPRED